MGGARGHSRRETETTVSEQQYEKSNLFKDHELFLE